MTDMLQTFMRMANLYNPQQMGSDMPSELPLQTRPPQIPTRLPYDESINVPIEEEPQSTLEAFRQSVLNPPKRTHMTYPKSTLNGLTEALKIAAEPTPTQQNRVYVNNQPYQKAKVYTDPTTGEKKFITAHDPSFGTQVMRAMPAAVSGAVDILNQPYTDAVSDWEMKNKGLASAANAESQMALANQRNAQAGVIPETAAARTTTANAAMMNAQTRKRLAELNTLTDEDKILLLQKGKITLQEIQDAAAMDRLERSGEIKSSQITQQGNIRSGQIAQQGNIRTGQIAQQGSLAQELARIRGEEARKTKGTPSANAGATSQLPTQQKVALQAKTQNILNQHPEWSEYVSFNDQGFPVITMPDTHWGPGNAPEDKATYDAIYNAIYGEGQPAPIEAPTTKQQTTAPSTKAPGSSKMPPPKVKAAPGSTSMVPMTAPDGTVRMVPENQVQVALGQGFKYKTASK